MALVGLKTLSRVICGLFVAYIAQVSAAKAPKKTWTRTSPEDAIFLPGTIPLDTAGNEVGRHNRFIGLKVFDESSAHDRAWHFYLGWCIPISHQ
jgi:hypothetical protein